MLRVYGGNIVCLHATLFRVFCFLFFLLGVVAITGHRSRRDIYPPGRLACVHSSWILWLVTGHVCFSKKKTWKQSPCVKSYDTWLHGTTWRAVNPHALARPRLKCYFCPLVLLGNKVWGKTTLFLCRSKYLKAIFLKFIFFFVFTFWDFPEPHCLAICHSHFEMLFILFDDGNVH